MNTPAWMILAAAAALLTGCQSAVEDSETRPQGTNVLDKTALREAVAGQVDFARHVKPVLEAKCAACHNREALPGRLSLENRREAVRTGTLGVFIRPGRPDLSPLITNVTSAHASVKAMPAVGETLTREEIQLLRRWILQGAVWPDGAPGTLKLAP